MAVTFNEEQQRVFDETIAAKQEQWRRRYEGYMSPDDLRAHDESKDKQISDLTAALEKAQQERESMAKDIADRDGRIAEYERHSVKTRIAHEAGLGFEAIGFLHGDDEESIKKSAEALKLLVGSGKSYPPASPEAPKGGDSMAEAEKNLVRGLMKK